MYSIDNENFHIPMGSEFDVLYFYISSRVTVLSLSMQFSRREWWYSLYRLDIDEQT